MPDPSTAWEQIARSEPYYGVLTAGQFLGAASSPERLHEFFATGDADVASVLSSVSRHLGRDFVAQDALDFGCGVGRLTFALGRRAIRVIGLDVAPTMIAIANRHRDLSDARNVRFETAGKLEELPDRSIDLIVSLIVFQHIPVPRGMKILRSLLGKLRPGGAAALHFSLARSGGTLRRFARTLRSRSALIHRMVQIIRREHPRLPYMEMNEYDLHAIRAELRAAGCGEPSVEETDHGGLQGVILVAEKLGS